MSASVVEAFCFSNPIINALLHLVCAPFVLELTRLGIKMEGVIARDGHLKGASQWLVEIAAKGMHIHNPEQVPAQGPVLFLCNHAGLGDAFALLMASPRYDTKIMAFDFGILPGLEMMRRHVVIIDKAQPHFSLRESLRHLQAGESILLYPRGEIEADPALYLDEALASLSDWSFSPEFFLRHVPALVVVPVAAGGVISRRALRNPLVRRYRDSDKRHFLAATFQMMFPFYRDPVISLFFGRALPGEQASRDNVQRQMAELLHCVHAEQQSLMNQVP